MYLGYQRIAITDLVQLGSAAFTLPVGVNMAELQSETSAVRYTMDNATNPSTSQGMLLRLTDEPKLFLIENLLRMRFCRDGGANAVLNVHYSGGRSV